MSSWEHNGSDTFAIVGRPPGAQRQKCLLTSRSHGGPAFQFLKLSVCINRSSLSPTTEAEIFNSWVLLSILFPSQFLPHPNTQQGPWARKFPITCTDVGVGPRTGVLRRGGPLGKMSQIKQEIYMVLSLQYYPRSKLEKPDCPKSPGQISGRK